MLRLAAVSLLVVTSAIVAAGCGPEAKVAAGLIERSAARLAVSEARVAVSPTLTKITARSTMLGRGAEGSQVTVRSETAAAVALEDSPMMRQAAQQSDERVDLIAAKTTRDPVARARVKGCAKAGATDAAQSYASSYMSGDSSPAVDQTIAGAVSSCLQKAFPNQAAAVHYVSTAVTNSVLASSQEAGRAQATAQDYTDWLVYLASLYETHAPPESPAAPASAPTATDVSVDDLLVVLYQAHAGRVAVGAGNWSAAIANRVAVLNELGTLAVAGELEGQRRLLVRAMRASLASDRYHAACGACAAPYDAAATQSKQAFVQVFNPYVQARYGTTVDAGAI